MEDWPKVLKLLHKTAQFLDLPWLDWIVFKLLVASACVVSGFVIIAVAFALLEKFGVAKDIALRDKVKSQDRRVNVVGVVVSTIVSYFLWIAGFLWAVLCSAAIFSIFDRPFPKNLIWIPVGCAYIINFISLGLIGVAIRDSTLTKPRFHAAVVGLLFIGSDLLVAKFTSISFGQQPIVFYIVSFCAACWGDSIFFAMMTALFIVTHPSEILGSAISTQTPTDLTHEVKPVGGTATDNKKESAGTITPRIRDKPMAQTTRKLSHDRVFIGTANGLIYEKKTERAISIAESSHDMS